VETLDEVCRLGTELSGELLTASDTGETTDRALREAAEHLSLAGQEVAERRRGLDLLVEEVPLGVLTDPVIDRLGLDRGCVADHLHDVVELGTDACSGRSVRRLAEELCKGTLGRLRHRSDLAVVAAVELLELALSVSRCVADACEGARDGRLR